MSLHPKSPLRCLVLVLLATACHASGDDPFEWAAVFDTDDGHNLTWTAQQVNGAWAASSMKMVLLNAAGPTYVALTALETEANHGFNTTCIEAEPGTVLIPALEDTCYNLHMEGGASATWTIPTANANHLAIFTEHQPSEFEADTHYLREGTTDINPAALLSEDGHDHSGEAHGDDAFEWAAVFDTDDGHNLTWTAQQVNGAWAASSMKMVLLNAAGPTYVALTALETEANHGFNTTCIEAEPGTVLIPALEDTCYNLHMEGGASATWTIPTANANHLAIFTEHQPSEFEADTHYLKHGRCARPRAD